MKIDVLRIDGLDAALQGWRMSRHDDAAGHWREVHTIDIPVNELPSAVVEVRDVTILEREIWTSMRSHVVWARTSHVDDPTQFVVPAPLAVRSNEENRARMVVERAAGASQDEWRRHLPVTSTTSFVSRISFRDLVKLAMYFNYLIDRVHVDLGQLMDKAFHELWSVIHTFTADDDLSHAAARAYQEVKFLHEGGIMAPRATTEVGEFFHITLVVPIWLRAQIVRHRPLAFCDTFFRDVLENPEVLNMTIASPVAIEIAAAKSYWRSVLSKRTCWLAQDTLATRRDPWQEIIDAFGFRPDMLPCVDGVCPYHGDAALRVSGSDPGVPCPRFLNITGTAKDDYRDRMIVAARSRHPYWLTEIES